ncbi:hypothetical protein P8452_17389 [Trifolium repens]|nr:hypothetical protein P8452_17389 [Trifolium repens]
MAVWYSGSSDSWKFRSSQHCSASILVIMNFAYSGGHGILGVRMSIKAIGSIIITDCLASDESVDEVKKMWAAYMITNVINWPKVLRPGMYVMEHVD